MQSSHGLWHIHEGHVDDWLNGVPLARHALGHVFPSGSASLCEGLHGPLPTALMLFLPVTICVPLYCLPILTCLCNSVLLILVMLSAFYFSFYVQCPWGPSQDRRERYISVSIITIIIRFNIFKINLLADITKH